jgi:hypothetical protein
MQLSLVITYDMKRLQEADRFSNSSGTKESDPLANSLKSCIFQGRLRFGLTVEVLSLRVSVQV